MICENCDEDEATATAIVVELGDAREGIRLALCEDCVSSEDAPHLIVDASPQLDLVRAQRQGDHHMICSTHPADPCPCVGRRTEWDECCCFPADRTAMRTKCLSCGQTMYAIDVNSGEPLWAVS